MLSVKLNAKDFSKTMKNVVAYSMGFLEGIESDRLAFNRMLGEYTKQALGKYIDAKARGNPDALHHVYEVGGVGSEDSRLFNFNVAATKANITLSGYFFPSSGVPNNGGYPFTDKAQVMEDGISITITPKRSKVLVFEYKGETVFTPNAITIDHPGGDQVAGSFGRVVDEFFLNYFTNAMLAPMIADLQKADEFTRYFPSGASGGGRAVGLRAGRSYLNILGAIE